MNSITFKNLSINLDTKLCFINNEEIDLTKAEYNLLVFFLLNQNKIFTRREIINQVWDRLTSFRAVDTTVSRLRKKLGVLGSYIKTRLGFGYGFGDMV